MFEYKLLQLDFRGTVTKLAQAHETTLNDYAAQGWRVVGCAMIYQTVLVYTLERPHA